MKFVLTGKCKKTWNLKINTTYKEEWEKKFTKNFTAKSFLQQKNFNASN